MKRRPFLLLCASSLLAGCSSWNLFSPSKPNSSGETAEEQPHTVGDLAIPFGMFPVKIEAVGLVSGLHGTGSDPEPSPQRAMLMAEMQRRGVENPNQLLATRNYSLVLVRGILRPGIQKGDHFDVELRIKDRSETTSLRGGYLLETRLSDMAVIYGKVFDGKVRGIAQGPLLVDPSATAKKDAVQLGRGVVLGGGMVVDKSRSVGLFLKNAEETNMTPEQLLNAAVKSAQVANAINRRFSAHKSGIKVGVARAIRGNYVDLIVDPTYKDNLVRYFQVLRAIELRETPQELNQRIAKLQTEIFNPDSAAEAAVKLEAIGKPAINALISASTSHDPKVQFFAAESLAYLDRREAAVPLGIAARNAAFRGQALTALSVMRDTAAYEQLRELLGVPSAETRYGAFRALTVMCPEDSLVKGEPLSAGDRTGGDQFSYHVLDTQGPPMIHVTRNRRAEVVLFGVHQRFLTPLAPLNAGNQIMVTGNKDGEISVSKFVPHEADQKRVVSTKVDEVVRAIVELGGTYPDVVQVFEEAKAAGCLEGRFEIDALPESGRSYEATVEDAASEDEDKGEDEATGAKEVEKKPE